VFFNGRKAISSLSVAAMDDREVQLGFKPQKEVPYNALLPYADSLDAESNDQLSHIKGNLPRVVQLRDIKIGGSHWTGQLSKSVLSLHYFLILPALQLNAVLCI